MGRASELAEMGLVQLQVLYVVAQVVGVLSGTVAIAVPEQPLDPLQRAQ